MLKTFKVDGMGCMHCVNKLQSNFGEMDSVSEVEVSLEKGTMTLTYDENKLSDEDVCNKVAVLGYTCSI